MQDHTTPDSSRDPEVLSARHDVEVARAELEVRLHDVARSGRRALTRIGRQARPMLVGAALIVGAVVLVRALRSGSRARRRAEWRSPGRASLLGVALRSTLDFAVRTAVTQLARYAARRLVSGGEQAQLLEAQPSGVASLSERPNDG